MRLQQQARTTTTTEHKGFQQYQQDDFHKQARKLCHKFRELLFKNSLMECWWVMLWSQPRCLRIVSSRDSLEPQWTVGS